MRERALDHLYRGQSNDCYWHGWFGGIYIVHMRLATLAELIAAEDLALGDAALTGVADYDLDGVDEVALGTPGQTVIVDVAEGAGIGSWDLRATRLALASVLRRRPEAYHRQIIQEAEHKKVEQLDDPASVSLMTDETAQRPVETHRLRRPRAAQRSRPHTRARWERHRPLRHCRMGARRGHRNPACRPAKHMQASPLGKQSPSRVIGCPDRSQ